MSLILISIKKFFQFHPALGEVPTCFKKKKTKLSKKPTTKKKKKLINKRRRRI